MRQLQRPQLGYNIENILTNYRRHTFEESVRQAFAKKHNIYKNNKYMT